MAIAKFRELWKNEYFQTIVMTALMLVVVFGFWFGSQAALNTQYPALAVVSTSMLPTLNVGDIIIVQGAPASQIYANYTTGDVIVYKSLSDPNKLIVHRAVYRELRSDGYWLTTKGDNNVGADIAFPENRLVGKVVARVPHIGNFVLFVNALGNFYFVIILIVLAVNVLISILLDSREKKSDGKPREKKKLFGKLSIEMIFFLALNVLLIGLIVFNLIGNFSFHQIGAEPAQDVPIFGMYADLHYQSTYGEVFKRSFNNVTDAYLSQGILTYLIDCHVSDGTHVGIRPGIPTFSWMQAALLVLLILDSWLAVKYLNLFSKFRPRKTEVNVDNNMGNTSETQC